MVRLTRAASADSLRSVLSERVLAAFTSGSMPPRSPIATRMTELSASTDSACAAAAFTESSSCPSSTISMRTTSHSCSSFRFASARHITSHVDIKSSVVLLSRLCTVQ